MKEISKTQIMQFHVLLKKNGLADDKRNIVSQISGGRTESTTQLTWWEAQQWINAMNRQQPEQEDKRKKMVNHIIAMAWEMGWVKTITKVQPGGSMKKGNDYSDLHSWILKYGYLHKPLNDYKYNELPTLVTQFKEVYKSKMKIK